MGIVSSSSSFFFFKQKFFFVNGYRMYGSIVTLYMGSTDDFGDGDGRSDM